MKITCPKNPAHNRFEVSAHVAQLWLVDEEGNFMEEIDGCSEVTHEPDSQSMFICQACDPGEEVLGVITQ
jgi:hypothetical protein